MEFEYPVPVGSVVTQRFGANGGHNGLDFGVPKGTPVRAAAGGTVSRAGWDSTGYGLHVRIDHGGGWRTLYGHLEELRCGAGERVETGAVIGLSGSTGRSTGPHLHFEVRMNGQAVDPESLLKQPPAVVLPAKPAPPAGPALYAIRITARDGVYIRATPGVDGAKVGGAVCGRVLDCYGAAQVGEDEWARVWDGWLCLRYEGQALAVRESPSGGAGAYWQALDAWARANGFRGPALPAQLAGSD